RGPAPPGPRQPSPRWRPAHRQTWFQGASGLQRAASSPWWPGVVRRDESAPTAGAGRGEACGNMRQTQCVEFQTVEQDDADACERVVIELADRLTYHVTP